MESDLIKSYIILFTITSLIATGLVIHYTNYGPEIPDPDIPYISDEEVVSISVSTPENYTDSAQYQVVDNSKDCITSQTIEEAYGTYNTEFNWFEIPRKELDEDNLLKLCRNIGDSTEQSQTFQITINENKTEIKNHDSPDTPLTIYRYNQVNRLFDKSDLQLEFERISVQHREPETPSLRGIIPYL